GGGSIATSDDAGATWSDQGAISGSLLRMIWGNDEFMLFGNGEIATSPDGMTWTVDNTIPIVMNAGVYAPEISLYVAIGSTSTKAAAISSTFIPNTTLRVDAGNSK